MCCILIGRDQLTIGVLVRKASIAENLNRGIMPSVGDTQWNDVNIFTGTVSMLLLYVARELRSAAGAICVGKDAEVARLILGEGSVEGF